MVNERAEMACRAFFQNGFTSISPFGDGHINETFCVLTAGGDKYVCQRVRKEMDISILERNYLLYARAFENVGWPYPTWQKSAEGRYFFTDPEGDHWRTYPFIEGEVLQDSLTKEELVAFGQGLARLHKILQTLPEGPAAVYPVLHDLGHYYERYVRLLEGDGLIEVQRDGEAEEWIRSGISRFQSLKLDKTAVIHGDPKLANAIFQDGQLKTFIDLDTIMQGSLLEDVADSIRSCCTLEGRINGDAARAFVQGYLNVQNGLLTEADCRLLPMVIRKICFELGLRYYTDSIAKEKSFHEKYPGYLLEKARGYFVTAMSDS